AFETVDSHHVPRFGVDEVGQIGHSLDAQLDGPAPVFGASPDTLVFERGSPVAVHRVWMGELSLRQQDAFEHLRRLEGGLGPTPAVRENYERTAEFAPLAVAGFLSHLPARVEPKPRRALETAAERVDRLVDANQARFLQGGLTCVALALGMNPV